MVSIADADAPSNAGYRKQRTISADAICALAESVSRTVLELGISNDSPLFDTLDQAVSELFVGKDKARPYYQTIKLQN